MVRITTLQLSNIHYLSISKQNWYSSEPIYRITDTTLFRFSITVSKNETDIIIVFNLGFLFSFPTFLRLRTPINHCTPVSLTFMVIALTTCFDNELTRIASNRWNTQWPREFCRKIGHFSKFHLNIAVVCVRSSSFRRSLGTEWKKRFSDPPTLSGDGLVRHLMRLKLNFGAREFGQYQYRFSRAWNSCCRISLCVKTNCHSFFPFPFYMCMCNITLSLRRNTICVRFEFCEISFSQLDIR